MITLDATTKTLEIDLTGAVATNQLPFVASYVDISQSTFAMTGIGEQDGTSNNTTAVTCLSAPGASTSRVLKFFSWKNSDTAAVEGWIQLNNNGTLREIWKGTLQVGDTLEFVDADNFKVIDANGNVKTTVGTVPSSIVLGTTTNDSAAAGRIGEYVSSVIDTPTNFPASTQFGDLTSISLTAGDWDISLSMVGSSGGATVTLMTFGVSTTSGNSSSGLVVGDSRLQMAVPTSVFDVGGSIPSYRMSLAATTTVYFKYAAVYSVATPNAVGRISARRSR